MWARAGRRGPKTNWDGGVYQSITMEDGLFFSYLLSRAAFDGVVYGDGKSATRYHLVTTLGDLNLGPARARGAPAALPGVR